jgi:hypothetical protein
LIWQVDPVNLEKIIPVVLIVEAQQGLMGKCPSISVTNVTIVAKILLIALTHKQATVLIW